MKEVMQNEIQEAQKEVAPVHIISLGAGVQSSTMALMAAKGEITPMPDCAIFADTQDEPQEVYRWLDWLEGQLPYPVYRVTYGSLSAHALEVKRSKKSGKLYQRGGIPVYIHNGQKVSMMMRTCTGQFKIRPIQQAIRRRFRPTPEAPIILWIGISLDEVIRMKESMVPWIVNTYPLVDKRMSRHDALRWMEARKYPPPPRSACVYCPYRDDSGWREMKNNHPEDFEKAVQFERDYNVSLQKSEVGYGTAFIHRSGISLDKADFSSDKGGQMMFGNECEGMCGV